MDMHTRMKNMLLEQQARIVSSIEALDPSTKFFIDNWDRPDGNGGGVSAVIEKGEVIERGAANISYIAGVIPKAGILKMRENHASMSGPGIPDNLPFRVAGLSLIMHPVNPFAPTVHLNYRYFETQNEDGTPLSWWFGGGSDLTPYYLIEEDAVAFHQILKNVCDKYSPKYYPEFKGWCDRYFFNHHRGESRGIGGIFFDDLDGPDPMPIFEFCRDALSSFVDIYVPILKNRMSKPYTPEEKEWQEIRRGRYVEFNLVHDRGTAFGLQTPGARIESILVSMPLRAQWRYDYHPPPGSPEDTLVKTLHSTRDWAAEPQSTYNVTVK